MNERVQDAIARGVAGRLQTVLSENSRDEIERQEEVVIRAEARIRDTVDTLKRLYVEKDTALTRIQGALNGTNEAKDRAELIIAEILALSKVVDCDFANNSFTFKTEKLATYDRQGNKRYLGEYTVTVSLSSCEVRIYNDETAVGFWSQNDPHPHVSGRSNKACFGNVAATIAVLAQEREFAALASVIISFLESVNEDDPAGAMVRNWAIIDEDWNIIKPKVLYQTYSCDYCGGTFEALETEIHVYTCENCGDITCPDCQGTVFVGDTAHRWCTGCIEHHTKWCGKCNYYIPCDDVIKVYTTYTKREHVDVCEHCVENNPDDFVECTDCGEYFSADIMAEINGDLVCVTCARNRGYIKCVSCARWIDSDDAGRHNGRAYCGRCLRTRDLVKCVECGQYHTSVDRVTSNRGSICRGCARTLGMRLCTRCGDYDDNITNVRGNDVCQQCLEDVYGTCPNCEQTFHHDQMESVDGVLWCIECADELMEEDEDDV